MSASYTLGIIYFGFTVGIQMDGIVGAMLHANPALKRLVLTNAKRKYPRDFTGWSRRMDLPEGALDAREGDQQEEIYPSDEFVDFERGESSSSST